ncbi:MAG TPA: hypothetical protein DEF51_50975 [Myxococcales bacterium]|nr:hypothetical protein [Myxococcales bacterium]
MGVRWDAIVVGTGFGGSVTAARLAERGLRVLVLERGPWWGPGGRDRLASERRDFPRGTWGARRLVRSVRWARRGRARELTLRSDGLWEMHRFDHLIVLTASGIGGGSLVYTNMQVPPEPDYFAAYPPPITAESMAPYYARVHMMLRPAPVPSAGLPEKLRAFERAASAASMGAVHRPELAIAFGDPTAPMSIVNAAGVEQGTCDYRGECILGCPRGAKTTLDLTYLAVALRHGATVRALTEAMSIERAGASWSVRCVDHRDGRTFEPVADRLYLCAGTLQSVRLLFEASRRLEMPPALGRRFSANGDHASLLRGLPPAHGDAPGPSVTGFVRVPPVGKFRGVIAEMGIPPAAALPALIRRYLRGSTAILAMGRDGARGRLSCHDGHLHTDLGRDANPSSFDALEERASELADAYGARSERLNVPAGRGARTLATVHPLGGAAMADDPRGGVVDHLGRVFGQPGLYVIDGSILPDAPGVPPSMTIAALAERLVGSE